MLTDSGEVSALYITNLEQHKEIYNFAKHENCPNDILKDIEINNKTLWFYQSQIKSQIDWKQHLISLESISLKDKVLYYSYTKTVPFIDKNKVVSFNQYKLDN